VIQPGDTRRKAMNKENNMADTTESLEKIEAKIDKGEALTATEEKLLNDAPDTKDQAAEAEAEDPVDPETIKTSVKKAADTPAEKDADAAKAKKEKAAEEAGAIDPDREKLIKADAEKPLDEINIDDYSQRERALFFELKEERQKRQASQREADTLKFNRAKEEARRQIEAEKKAAAEREEAEKETDPFEGVEDDDLLTAGQLKKLLAGKKKTDTSESKMDPAIERSNKLQMENWILKAQTKLPDVDLQTVTQIADEVLMRNGVRDEAAAAEIDEVVAKGGNPLIATYNYLKAHPKHSKLLEERLENKFREEKGFPKLEKDEEARTNKERAERIEANKKKPVTTGSGGGVAASGEYTVQEILDMSDSEYAKLPKSQRDKILESL